MNDVLIHFTIHADPKDLENIFIELNNIISEENLPYRCKFGTFENEYKKLKRTLVIEPTNRVEYKIALELLKNKTTLFKHSGLKVFAYCNRVENAILISMDKS